MIWRDCSSVSSENNEENDDESIYNSDDDESDIENNMETDEYIISNKKKQLSITTNHNSEDLNEKNILVDLNSEELSVLEELERAFEHLRTREEVIQVLENSNLLHRIPLGTPKVGIEQAKKDFRRERVLLNEVPFIPDRFKNNFPLFFFAPFFPRF
jgi:hypothetical protein